MPSICQDCGESDDWSVPNTEAFEMTGRLVCNMCADTIFDEQSELEAHADGQPDEAQEWADFDRDC